MSRRHYWESRRHIRERIEAPLDDSEKDQTCYAWGCKRHTRRAAQNGLSQTYCKYHSEFIRRHGCSWRGSFTPSEIKPFRQAALTWLQEHQEDVTIQRHLRLFEQWFMGRDYVWHDPRFKEVRDPSHLRWLKPVHKARFKALRLAQDEVKVEKIVADILASEAATKSPLLTTSSSIQWREHQLGKLLNRMAPLVPREVQHQRPAYVRTRLVEPEGSWIRILGKLFRDALDPDDFGKSVDEIVASVKEIPK